jgi:hypothetical protein
MEGLHQPERRACRIGRRVLAEQGARDGGDDGAQFGGFLDEVDRAGTAGDDRANTAVGGGLIPLLRGKNLFGPREFPALGHDGLHRAGGCGKLG